MPLRLIVGRAGSGKTRRCLEEIREQLQRDAGIPLIFLVPEQATFYTEKNIQEFCRLDGTIRAQVLSFQRLAWRVLQETGGGIRPVIDEMGKAMILRRVLEANRNKIKTFSRVMDKPGFLEKLVQVISEFKTYGISPQKLEEYLEVEGDLQGERQQAKLEELTLIFWEYEAYLQDHYLDTDDYLSLLAASIHRSPYLKGAQIWLDGFHGFTPQEYLVIRELLLCGGRVNLTLCLDGAHLKRKLAETDLFYTTWETYQKISYIAQEIGCSLEETVLLDYSGEHRFSHTPLLACLERCMAGEKTEKPSSMEAVKLVLAPNRRAELEEAAREIIRLCREEGYRYREIALLFRDISSYEGLLSAVFSHYGIPYFLDKKRTLKHHPLLDLIQGALEVVEKGWNYEPLFRYLKTDLTPLSRQETDLLENYCLAHGIRGSRWTDGRPWNYRRIMTLGIDQELIPEMTKEEARLLRRVNRAREKAVQALLALEKSCKTAQTGRAFAHGLYRLLEELEVARKLEYWSGKAETEGFLEQAQVHGQVWNNLMELLDQLVEVLGEQPITIKEFIQVLNSGLENIKLGLIPPGLDQVTVGSVDRSRNPDLKAVFLPGVNEGIFPARHGEEGLISDEERKYLAGRDLILAPGTDQKYFAEQYLVYLALTRAERLLWVSCPLADEEGRALTPSRLMGRLEDLLSIQAVDSQALEQDEERLAHPRPVLGSLAAALREALDGGELSPFWKPVYNWYQARAPWQEPLGVIASGLFVRNGEEMLDQDLAQRLYGSYSRQGSRAVLQTSISRLEKFKACPYAHFLEYGLRLKEREEFKLKSPDLGQFFHGALEGVYAELRQKEQNLAEMDLRQVENLVFEVTQRLAPQLQNEILLSTARYRFMTRKLQRTVLRAVKVLREHELRGTFRPLGVEISFGGNDGGLPALELTLADGTTVLLRGRIDRVDGAAGEGVNYLRVIDYKSGTPSISLLEVFYGLKLQLLAYLDVLINHAPQLIQGESRPGGVLYFKVFDPFISHHGPLAPEEVERRILKELKMKGYLLKDPRVIKLMDERIQGHSEIIPARINKDQEISGNVGSLLSLEEFSLLCRHVEKVLKEISTEILAGNVAAQPCRYKGRKPCKYCIYEAVCRFDTMVPGCRFRNLPEKDRDLIWQELGRKEGDGHGTGELDLGTGKGD